MKPRYLVLSAILPIVACASAPKIDYYTLAVERSGLAEPAVNLQAVRITTTEALVRSQIMIQASPTRIDYYATDHWVGGLGDLVRRKLDVELGPAVEGRRNLQLEGTLLSCEQVDTAGGADGRVVLQITVRDPAAKSNAEPLFEKTYEVVRPARTASAAAAVVALSHCVEEIAAQIAADTAVFANP